MLRWGLLLHFYQPPWQTWPVLDRVVRESYRPLIEAFLRYPDVRATVNVQGILLDLLAQHGYQDVLDGMARLIREGRWELVGSAACHPILPLVEPEEAARQILLQQEACVRHLGMPPGPGFFPPELCIGEHLPGQVAAAGHRWFVASGIACPLAWPTTTVMEVAGSGGVRVVFRDDVLSNAIAFVSMGADGFLADLRRRVRTGDQYVVTAMDAETFGHHHARLEHTFLEAAWTAMAGEQGMTTSTVGHIVDTVPVGSVVAPLASSWSTSRQDLDQWVPYPLWRHPANPVHDALWEHLAVTRQILGQLDQADHGAGSWHVAEARRLWDQSLHSCPFWWASGRPHWEAQVTAHGPRLQQAAALEALRAYQLAGQGSGVDRGVALRHFHGLQRLEVDVLAAMLETDPPPVGHA